MRCLREAAGLEKQVRARPGGQVGRIPYMLTVQCRGGTMTIEPWRERRAHGNSKENVRGGNQERRVRIASTVERRASPAPELDVI